MNVPSKLTVATWPAFAIVAPLARLAKVASDGMPLIVTVYEPATSARNV